MQICIGGSFRVEGRFAIGYDTSGLRKVLEGGTGTHLLDGIFFDDYNAAGARCRRSSSSAPSTPRAPSASTSSRSASAERSSSRPRSTSTKTTPQDGKLRIEEIISRLSNPLCLFDVSGKIEAALSAFVEIDLFITSIEFSIEIVRITLLEFDLDVCSRNHRTSPTCEGEVLCLHMGSS